jgi:thiamine pyrophosphate-dependent acetolactate synthase large subunit-like protein
VDDLTGRVVVLAGPGVVDAGALEALRALADDGSLGVANTWGAKGVFNWDSPHHLGTCGLQARDFELLGWADADVIVATGVDEGESPRERYGLAEVVTIDPVDLAAAIGQVRATGEPPDNELYPRLAAVAQPGFVDTRVPLHPARAVADLGAAVPPGGLVTADPGVAGLWVARTFPTPALSPAEPRRVVVPSRRQPGAAAVLALEAARAGRPAIAVTTAPLDDATTTALANAEREHLPLVVAAWGDLSAQSAVRVVDDHRRLLTDALGASGPSVIDVPVSLADTQLLIEAAGEVVAWGGLT